MNTRPLTSFFKTPIDGCVSTFFSSLPKYNQLGGIVTRIVIEGTGSDTIGIDLIQNNNLNIQNIIPVDFHNAVISNNQINFKILEILNTKLQATSPILQRIWNSFNIDGVIYEFPEFLNQTLNIDLSRPATNSKRVYNKTFIQNINSFKIRFIGNGNTPIPDIKYIFRLLSVCDSDLFDLLLFALDKDPNFQLEENEIAQKSTIWGWGIEELGLFKEIMFIEGLKVNKTAALVAIPKYVYATYNPYPEFFHLKILEEFEHFDTKLNEPTNPKNHLGFVYEKENSLFFMTIFKESEFTFDLIHVKGDIDVNVYTESADCQDYVAIVNGPFYDGSGALNGNGIQIGFRKYRRTKDGMPQELCNDEDMGKWFYGAEDNEFSANVIINATKELTISKGLLQKSSLRSSICSFDGVIFSYDATLPPAEQPCNPDSNKFTQYKNKKNIGNLSNNIGIPFIGVIEKSGIKYIFSLTLKQPSNFNRDHWYEIYEVLKTLNPQIAVFTDGNDSVFLKYHSKRIMVGFGGDTSNFYSGKNRNMPCIIGIIEKSKI